MSRLPSKQFQAPLNDVAFSISLQQTNKPIQLTESPSHDTIDVFANKSRKYS